ncbi:hypothetical protein SBOR_5427 [Sclerotinia borealis F-4128]|uniref:Mitochondrial inner membrane protease subunit 2 n=1 Tax=Sclerotinia borealis (strain F-4128) TaxID=1432307 RepID=W9CEA7_SCLBF|nr:hypothetical protein SBOR_5427 [Sclerotinia borealis F-4128]
MSQRLFSALRKGSPARHFLKDFSYWGIVIASWVPAVIFFNDHVAELHTINGASMYPFLNTGSPYNPNTLAVKRIIALEGDRVYTHAPYPYPISDIPAGHVWVEGDNTGAMKSLDSNHYGPIAVNLITGKPTYILWPWSSVGAIKWERWKGRTRVVRGWNGGG